MVPKWGMQQVDRRFGDAVCNCAQWLAYPGPAQGRPLTLQEADVLTLDVNGRLCLKTNRITSDCGAQSVAIGSGMGHTVRDLQMRCSRRKIARVCKCPLQLR